MTAFQSLAVGLIALWLAMVLVWFRSSKTFLIAGLAAIGVLTLAGVAAGTISPSELGLSGVESWAATISFAMVWLGLMWAYSPLADRIATRLVPTPPTLDAFRILQQSRIMLILGIIVAWVLGGFLEELALRAIVLRSVESGMSALLPATAAAGIAVAVAAAGAGVMHLYQGLRAVVIVTQLSVLFGVLFVVNGHDLWAVILCHGLYDTIAFIRFANKASKYSRFEDAA
jgi:membrane protease YdiL (CAAX protease family)